MAFVRGSSSGPNRRNAEAGESLNDLMRAPLKNASGSKRGDRRTLMSAACKKGKHTTCYAVSCQCACGHPA